MLSVRISKLLDERCIRYIKKTFIKDSKKSLKIDEIAEALRSNSSKKLTINLLGEIDKDRVFKEKRRLKINESLSC